MASDVRKVRSLLSLHRDSSQANRLIWLLQLDTSSLRPSTYQICIILSTLLSSPLRALARLSAGLAGETTMVIRYCSFGNPPWSASSQTATSVMVIRLKTSSRKTLKNRSNQLGSFAKSYSIQQIWKKEIRKCRPGF